MAAAREILVRGPNWLGDLVMATPGLRALREAEPDARITLWVRSGLGALLDGSDLVDRVIPLDRPGLGPRRWARAVASVRQPGGYDLGLCLPESFSSAALMRASGARQVVGYARDGRSWLLHRAVPSGRRDPQSGYGPREARILRLIESIGYPPVGTEVRLATTAAEERAADRLLDGAGPGARRALVGLAPGASFGPSKCWPPERFAAVADRLASLGVHPVLLGSPSEAALCARVADRMRSDPLDLSGQTPVGPLKAVIRRLALLVCNDAGARHIAAGFAVPTIVFFGPTSLSRTPWNLEHADVLQRELACRPCYRRECPIDHPCMREIEVDSVVALAEKRLAPLFEARA